MTPPTDAAAHAGTRGQRVGLAPAGGGARGAYEAGALSVRLAAAGAPSVMCPAPAALFTAAESLSPPGHTGGVART